MAYPYLQGRDWQEFTERYPTAYNFLLSRNNEREAEALRKEVFTAVGPRLEWITKRLCEFKQLNII